MQLNWARTNEGSLRHPPLQDHWVYYILKNNTVFETCSGLVDLTHDKTKGGKTLQVGTFG